MRSFNFAPPKNNVCDVLILAGEHSGDEQASRMLKKVFSQQPNLNVCAFGGQSLSEVGAQLLFDFTQFSVVGLMEVLKNYSFFKALSSAIVEWICKYKPKAVCFVDYPGFNLLIASELYKRGVSVKGGGSIKLLYYISPQIWAWKAKRRFKMARLLDSLAVIFPFEVSCYADTSLNVQFVGHPFLEEEFENPVEYSPDGDILLLAGSREIAVSRIFPVMLKALRKLDNEKAIALYPSESIKNILEKSLAKFPDVADRVKIVDKSALPLKAKAVMMSSGTMSLCCSLAGIPGAIVYKANPITYVLGRMLVKIQYLSIANILLDKPAWREFIQFDATDENIASYMRECLKPEVRTEFLEYANALKKLLHAETKKSASDWLLSEFVK
ncbi:MAG: lipid-A-disaccharide synthase [Verrucomicrobiaceae bacterium]|nr:lipid-A-disaccharide synthase [Verrucomicrobiaceae bacterium]